MKNDKLTTGYLSGITNALHDQTTQAILDYLKDANGPAANLPDNTAYTNALTAFEKARATEDASYKFSQKDFASNDLEEASKRTNNYMTAIRYALNGFCHLPKTDDDLRKAQELRQLYRDFKYSNTSAYGAKVAKVRNMAQEFEKKKADMETFGLYATAQKALAAANDMSKALAKRTDHRKNWRLATNMKTARKQTDTALQTLFDVIYGRSVLEPSDDLNEIITWLLALRDRTRKKKGSSTTDESTAQNSDGKSSSDESTSQNSDGKSSSDESTSQNTDDKSSSDESTSQN